MKARFLLLDFIIAGAFIRAARNDKKKRGFLIEFQKI
jgi:hypothetical protein